MSTTEPYYYKKITDYAVSFLGEIRERAWSEYLELKMKLGNGRKRPERAYVLETIEKLFLNESQLRPLLFHEEADSHLRVLHDYVKDLTILKSLFRELQDLSVIHKGDKYESSAFNIIGEYLHQMSQVVRPLVIDRSSPESWFDLLGVIEECKNQFRVQLRYYAIDLSIERESEHVEIKGRISIVGLALNAVILNSIEALAEIKSSNKQIRAGIKVLEGKVILTISDNGPGIAAAKIGEVFMLGFSTKNENSGIGLFLASEIIKLELNGECRIRNTRLGTEFTMAFKRQLREN